MSSQLNTLTRAIQENAFCAREMELPCLLTVARFRELRLMKIYWQSLPITVFGMPAMHGLRTRVGGIDFFLFFFSPLFHFPFELLGRCWLEQMPGCNLAMVQKNEGLSCEKLKCLRGWGKWVQRVSTDTTQAALSMLGSLISHERISNL
ncbi:hypothetical protein CEXT_247641 [Caerostris extrusa]|uniref:Uncharacterized protein n=1 Tax=Caerostris extrusa TaxID=172846 RepID=A0AAV4WU49_CAEEX|nr:hypothetical protein CEXT_247641 [Caerostris extrusa]